MSEFIKVAASPFPVSRPLAEWVEPLPRQSAPLDLHTEPGNLATDSSCVRLDLEELPCFTWVERQYEPWGVLFRNAIAISPSNPAFVPRSGAMVLLGAPKGGWMEASFIRPVQYVSSFITSPRLTIMRAFNRQNQLVAQAESAESLAPFLKGGRYTNSRLSLNATNIHRITLQSLNGQMTVDDFCFCG